MLTFCLHSEDVHRSCGCRCAENPTFLVLSKQQFDPLNRELAG